MSLNPYEVLRGVMTSHGATGSAEGFYWAINDAYHSVEASAYDDIHEDMYVGLLHIWQRLLGRISAEKVSVLDVGAGTGLMGEMLAKLCPDKIVRLTALDPSTSMLSEHRRKSEDWPFPTNYVLGDIRSLPRGDKYDLVTVNSVLHHIVELECFCKQIQEVVALGGFLATAQDPRAEAGNDSVLMDRRALAKKRWGRKLRSRDFLGRLIRRGQRACAATFGQSYIAPLARETNAILIRKKVISLPMTLEEIHSVTDFHVPSEGGWGMGVRVSELSTWLSSLSVVETLTYQFHDIEWTLLTTEERWLEMKWFSEGDVHGALFATLWHKLSK